MSKTNIAFFLLMLVWLTSMLLGYAIHEKAFDYGNIVFNIFSSTVVVLVVEILSNMQDLVSNSFLKGAYTRTEIFMEVDDNERVDDSKYKAIAINEQASRQFILKYIGKGMYIGRLFYNEGEATVTLTLDTNNGMTGIGSYQYFKETPDLGSYSFQVDTSREKIYLFYTNFLPSGRAKGYEVWEKANIKPKWYSRFI